MHMRLNYPRSPVIILRCHGAPGRPQRFELFLGGAPGNTRGHRESGVPRGTPRRPPRARAAPHTARPLAYTRTTRAAPRREWRGPVASPHAGGAGPRSQRRSPTARPLPHFDAIWAAAGARARESLRKGPPAERRPMALWAGRGG
eukprot:scaffold12262_cov121-Isochrysis_galbana.AAC.10